MQMVLFTDINKKVFLDYSKRYNRKQNILEFQQYPLSSKNIVKKKR